MKRFWFHLTIILWPIQVFSDREVNWNAPPIEKEHDPTRYTTPRSQFLSGTDIRVPDPFESPDFRVEEPFFLPHKPGWYKEEVRPYRISPHWITTNVFGSQTSVHIRYAGCYCTTVYKRLTPLAGCAVITTRHILTTATSTHLILRDKYDFPVLEDILGAWYDTNHWALNSSMYLSPARIHYHPLWNYPETVNRSHPFSVTFDLAVWASTYNVYGWYWNSASSYVCLRATSHPRDQAAPSPPTVEDFVVVGFQFMWAYKRKPTPFHKYAVRTSQSMYPCPKTDWGWFLCIPGEWAKLGIDNGAALHRAFKGRSWRYDGLVGLGALSMRLRTVEIVHYFTILDCHVVLDFLWDSYESNIPYVWLDGRFNDTKHGAPRVKQNYYVYMEHKLGDQNGFWPYTD